MRLMKDPLTELMIPEKLIEDKTSLKNCINKLVEDALNTVPLREDYFFILHAKFDEKESDTFVVSQMVASLRLPPFCSNQQVFYVSPKKGFYELLWTVPAKLKGEKLAPQFNTKGVAYLQAKGAMPS